MRKSVIDLAKLVLPTSSEKRRMLQICKPYLDADQYKDLAYFLKMDKLFGYIKSYKTTITDDPEWVEFKSHVADEQIKAFITEINAQVKRAADAESFTEFAPVAAQKIPKLVANNIAGLDDAKFAASLLLFADEPFHMLLLGDPGTGKTEILRSVAALAPKSAYGLGSGTSGVGLAGTFRGDELLPGLLPQAHEGVACIDELNLMKAQDRAALYNAMEKGFVSYEKGGNSVKLDARVRVIATANPKGDKFVGSGAAVLRKQLPFAQALLSRFHNVFLIRKPDARQLGRIASAIVQQEKQKLKKGDVEYVKAYVEWALSHEVAFDKKFEKMVVSFIQDLAGDEQKFLVEVGPRTVVGVIRMAKAYARMQGKEKVDQQDLSRVMRLLKENLYVRKSD